MTYLRAKIPREYAKMDMKWIATKTFKNEGAPTSWLQFEAFFRCREDHWKIILSPGSLFPKVLRGHLSLCSFHCCRPAVAFSAGYAFYKATAQKRALKSPKYSMMRATSKEMGFQSEQMFLALTPQLFQRLECAYQRTCVAPLELRENRRIVSWSCEL